MHTAQECQEALQKVAGRLAEIPPEERLKNFGDRTMSVTVSDLGVTFVTVLGKGDDPVRIAEPSEPKADIRLTAKSDDVLPLTEQPMNIGRAWMTGKVKIEASMKDLLQLRRLI